MIAVLDREAVTPDWATSVLDGLQMTAWDRPGPSTLGTHLGVLGALVTDPCNNPAEFHTRLTQATPDLTPDAREALGEYLVFIAREEQGWQADMGDGINPGPLPLDGLAESLGQFGWEMTDSGYDETAVDAADSFVLRLMENSASSAQALLDAADHLDAAPDSNEIVVGPDGAPLLLRWAPDGGLVLDCFAGPGGWSEGLLREHSIRDLGIEWDEWACKTRAAAGHRTVRADVSRFPLGPLQGKVWGLVSSPPCFPAGTRVLTTRGQVPIEDVRVGDSVLTHRNRWRPVVSTMTRQSPTVRLEGQGHWGMEATPDHPFYARSQSQTSNDAQRQHDRTLGSPDWTHAQDMQGRFWAAPSAVPPLPVPAVGGPGVEFTADFWRTVGRWLRDNQTGFTVSHRGLAEWLEMNFGEDTHGKALPTWALGMPEQWRRALLEGYTSAAGASLPDADGAFQAPVSSRSLAVGIRLLAESLGWTTTMHLRAARDELSVNGQPVNGQPGYTVLMTNDDKHAERQDTLTWGLVCKVLPGQPMTTVYDVTVADDESFVADGIVVHNCPDFSQAGKKAGLDGASGWLTGQVLVYAEALRPAWVLAEQVPTKPVLVLFEQYAARLRELGYRAHVMVLNAADYGVPQTRRRAVLLAHRNNFAAPVPTHALRSPLPSAQRNPSTLPPHRTMSDALGWGFTERPALTVTSQRAGSGLRFEGGSGARRTFAREQTAGRWAPRLVDGRFEHEADRAAAAGSGRMGRPTPGELGALQGFRIDYPWQGPPATPGSPGHWRAYAQVGNAVPPPLAAAAAAAVLRA